MIDHMLLVEGIETHCVIPRGLPNPAAQKRTLLLLHGLGGSSRHWNRMLPFLDEKIYPVAIDLPGHGRSGHLMPDSIGKAALFVAAVLERLHLDGPICCAGHSLGGALALALASMRPDKFLKLAIIASASQVQLHPDFLEQSRTATWSHEKVRQAFADEAEEEAIMTVYDDLRALRLRLTASTLANVAKVDLRAQLSAVRAPTVVVAAGRDVIISPRHARVLSQQLPDASLVEAPDSGHYVHLERPGRLPES